METRQDKTSVNTTENNSSENATTKTTTNANQKSSNQEQQHKQNQNSSPSNSNVPSGFDFSAIIKAYLPDIISAISGMGGSYFLWIKPIKKEIESLNEDTDDLKKQLKKVKLENESLLERLDALETKLNSGASKSRNVNKALDNYKNREKDTEWYRTIMQKHNLL